MQKPSKNLIPRSVMENSERHSHGDKSQEVSRTIVWGKGKILMCLCTTPRRCVGGLQITIHILKTSLLNSIVVSFTLHTLREEIWVESVKYDLAYDYMWEEKWKGKRRREWVASTSHNYGTYACTSAAHLVNWSVPLLSYVDPSLSVHFPSHSNCTLPNGQKPHGTSTSMHMVKR